MFAALSCLSAVSGDILAIDLGSQFFKVALVTTGKFEIVPNLQSKRKTPTAFSVKSKIREFGDDALLAQLKSPGKVGSFFRWFIGANLTATPAASLYHADMFAPSQVTSDEVRHSPVFGSEDFGHPQIEELLGHMIWYAKSLVEEHDTPGIGRHKLGSLKDLVITVPSWATKRERQAVIDAAHIAGFTKVSLVHETSTAAVQRALDLDLDANSTSVKTIYLNVGANHFEACVIEYGSVFKNPTAKTLGCAHSLKAGGSEITRILAQEGGKAFLKKHPKISKSNFEADLVSKVRLFRQAEQVKQTLSANKESVFSVESLFEEKDLKHPVSRADIERIAEPLMSEIQRVVESAIHRSNITREELTQAELIGGGWRVPAVQAKLEEMMHPVILGQHLNGDEAMVFGAAFIAANSSSSFRVRKVVFTETSENEYAMTVTPKNSEELLAGTWPRSQTIFARGNKINSVKAVKLNFKNSTELLVDVRENGNLIESFAVMGAPLLNETHPPDQIILKAKLDSDGIFSLAGCEAVYETLVEQTVTNSTSNETITVMVPKKTKKILTTELLFQALPLSMTTEDIKASQKKLRTVAEAESAIKNRTKTKNDLEALVYSLRDKMEDNSDVHAHSSPEERAHVVEVSKQVEAWLDDNSYSASVEEFKGQIDILKKSASEIFDRILQEKKAKQAEEDRIRKEAEELQKLKDAEEAAKKLQDEIAKMGDLNSTLDNLGNLTDLLKNFKFPNISFDPDSSENKDEDVPPSKEETLEDESPQQEEL